MNNLLKMETLDEFGILLVLQDHVSLLDDGVIGFALRENTGINPVSKNTPLIVECYYNHKDFKQKEMNSDDVDWLDKTTFKKWKPDIESLLVIQNDI